MSLESINRVMPATPVTSTSDASKNLQNQLMSKEQNLSQISNDASLDAREKAKKQQELQREIEELNRKLELMRIRQEENEKSARAKAGITEKLIITTVRSRETIPAVNLFIFKSFTSPFFIFYNIEKPFQKS